MEKLFICEGYCSFDASEVNIFFLVYFFLPLTKRRCCQSVSKSISKSVGGAYNIATTAPLQTTFYLFQFHCIAICFVFYCLYTLAKLTVFAFYSWQNYRFVYTSIPLCMRVSVCKQFIPRTIYAPPPLLTHFICRQAHFGSAAIYGYTNKQLD